MTLNRREFLQVMESAAATAAVGSLIGCRTPDQPVDPDAPLASPPRSGLKETWLVSTCGACPGGCGVRARIVEERLVGISGNPLHPINRGGLCPLGLAAAHTLYHPDRLRGPMRRAGAAGSGDFKSTTWADGIGDVSKRLRDLRDRGLSHTVAIVDGSRGLESQLAARFLESYGSPHHVDGRAWTDDRAPEAVRALQGISGPVSYDLENARFILAFGSGWLDGAASPVGAGRGYALARRARKSKRVHVVQIEPRLSVGAAHADEWIPIEPGTEGVLALGFMHLILREGLENRDFVDRWGTGFDALRGIVLRDYHPEAVAERTGIEVATLIRVARRFASTRPAVAIGDDRVGPGAQAVEARMAIHALNAVVGAINAPGGTLTPPPVPFAPLPATPADEAGKRGAAMPSLAGNGGASGLADLQSWIEGRGQYPINLLIVLGADPLAALGGGDKAKAALGRIPFIVSLSPFLDETARRADLVLPDHTWLERWQDDATYTSGGYPVLGLRRPLLPPKQDTRHAGETLAEIARGVGGATGGALPWKDFPEVMKLAIAGIHQTGRGAIFDVSEAEPWVETMEQSGWRASDFGSFDRFWSKLEERGGWWDPSYDFGERGRVLRTPSGKFEFQQLANAYDPATAARPSVVRVGDGTPTASADPEKRLHQEYPFRLHLYPLLAAYGDHAGPLPFVQDILGKEMEQSWRLWVELSPTDADALGLTDGTGVIVQSPDGEVEARVKVYPGIRPGVAAMPLGPGGAPGQICRRAMGASAGSLVALRKDPTGVSGWGAGWVRVRKA